MKDTPVMQDQVGFPTLAFWRGLIVIGHPVPSLLTALAGAAFFLIAQERARLDGHVIVFFASILLLQYSIGCMNDYVDEPFDRLAKRHEKPLVAGNVSRKFALFLWFSAAFLSFAISAYFGLAAALIAILLWLAGVAYNFWLKRTALSWLPFAFFFPSLPIWSFVAAGRFTPVVLSSLPLGGALSLALHIANTLPDLARDAASGVSGFTHRLGQRRALFLLWLLFGAAILLIALSPVLLGIRSSPWLSWSVIGSASALALMIGWLLNRSQASLRRTFYLCAVGAVVLGCVWMASLS